MGWDLRQLSEYLKSIHRSSESSEDDLFLDQLTNSRGATLIESMIASALIAITAVAVYPIFARTKSSSKFGDARQMCENIVRGKLDQYRNGLPVNLTQEGSRPILNRLTISQAPEVLNQGGDARFAGYLYAKYKYNQFITSGPTPEFSYCMGKSTARVLMLQQSPEMGSVRQLGRRECLDSDRSWSENPREPAANCTLDGVGRAASKSMDIEVSRVLPEFKLYVRLSSVSSWPLTLTGNSPFQGELEKRFGLGAFEGCPDASHFQLADPEPVHDFLGAGEGIKVTATGVIDFPWSGPMGSEIPSDHRYLGISVQAYQRFICQGSIVLRPELSQFRYYLSQDRRIYPESGLDLSSRLGGAPVPEAKRWPFFNFYHQGDSQGSGILSFAVHPRNLSVWVLKAGQLIRYSDCGGVPLGCSLQNDSARGISERGVLGWESVQYFNLPDNSIQSIGVDFRRGRVFGANANVSQIVELVGPNKESLFNLPTQGSSLNVSVLPLESTGDNKPGFFWTPGGIPNRLRAGFFLAPEGDQGFVIDYSGTQVLGYNTAVYSLTDTKLLRPVLRFPVSAFGFSR